MKRNNYRDEYEESKAVAGVGRRRTENLCIAITVFKSGTQIVGVSENKKDSMRYPRSPKQIKAHLSVALIVVHFFHCELKSVAEIEEVRQVFQFFRSDQF